MPAPCRSLGVACLSPSSLPEPLELIASVALKEKGLLNVGEKFVITGGVPVGIPGTTNYLSVLKIS